MPYLSKSKQFSHPLKVLINTFVMPFNTQKEKKKPPPRPPPPNFSKFKSKSTLYLNQQNQSVNLIEWSPPSSPKPDRTRKYGGSVSSSFSSSTSSLASSKKSFDSDGLPPVTNNMWPVQTQPLATFQSYLPTVSNPASTKSGSIAANNLHVPQFRPTIIRPKVKLNSKNDNLSTPSGSPPMPNIPPPSPPKGVLDIETPYGIALFDYPTSHPNDLNLQEGDVVVLMHRINNDWLYGKVIDKEGMFPESFIDIRVPLKEEENLVTALYDFPAQMPSDLSLKTGQKINVIKKVNNDWLIGESGGKTGQFPSNFVNRVPRNL